MRRARSPRLGCRPTRARPEIEGRSSARRFGTLAHQPREPWCPRRSRPYRAPSSGILDEIADPESDPEAFGKWAGHYRTLGDYLVDASAGGSAHVPDGGTRHRLHAQPDSFGRNRIRILTTLRAVRPPPKRKSDSLNQGDILTELLEDVRPQRSQTVESNDLTDGLCCTTVPARLPITSTRSRRWCGNCVTADRQRYCPGRGRGARDP